MESGERQRSIAGLAFGKQIHESHGLLQTRHYFNFRDFIFVKTLKLIESNPFFADQSAENRNEH
jgi:hypothetical protein